jgi:protein TonB
MHKAKEWLFEKQSFWISLLFHLLLFLSFVVVWHPVFLNKPDPKPELYLPSYVYQPPISVQQPQNQSQTKQVDLKPSNETDGLATQTAASHPAVNTSSTTSMAAKRPSPNTEGIHLVGDKNQVAKPLIKILAKNLSAHLIYPKIAADFKVRGTAYVGFTLHPDGSVTDIRLMQTSTANVLDQSALSAVRALSPGPQVGKYIKVPKFLVVGIIFG